MKSVLLFLLLMICPLTAQAGQESIVAVVNGGVITASDLKARLDLITASTGLPPTKENIEKLRPQILNALIDEQIRLQEADRLKIEITQKEIDDGFAMIAKQNNMEASAFRKTLQSHRVQVSTIYEQIKSQLAWTKIIQKRIRPRIEVSDADIDAELGRVKEKIGKDQYLISEILLPFTEKNGEKQVASMAQNLSSELSSHPEAFSKFARQFSSSPSAAKGGNMGWVMAGQLSDEVDAVLPKLVIGKPSSPISTASGYYILLLQNKRQLSEDKLPTRDDITEKIGMERMERAARQYLNELIRTAFVEKRV